MEYVPGSAITKAENSLARGNIEEKFWLPKDSSNLQLGKIYMISGFDHKKGISASLLDPGKVREAPTDSPLNAINDRCCVGFEGITVNSKETSRTLDHLLEETILFPSSVEKVLILAGHYLADNSYRSYVGRDPRQLFTDGLEISSKLRAAGKKGDLLIYINDLYLAPENRKDYYRSFTLPFHLEDEFLRHANGSCFVASQKRLCDRVLREKHRLIADKKLLPGTSSEGSEYYPSGEVSSSLPTNRFIITYPDPLSGYIRCVQACTKILQIAKQLGYHAVVQLYPVCGRSAVEHGVVNARKIYNVEMPIINVYKTKSCYS